MNEARNYISIKIINEFVHITYWIEDIQSNKIVAQGRGATVGLLRLTNTSVNYAPSNVDSEGVEFLYL